MSSLTKCPLSTLLTRFNMHTKTFSAPQNNPEKLAIESFQKILIEHTESLNHHSLEAHQNDLLFQQTIEEIAS